MRPSDSPEQDAAAENARAEFAQFALDNLFEVSPNAIFVTDAKGVIRSANPRATELFGYPHAELIGRPIEDLVPLRFRARHPSHRENYNAHPRTRQMGAAMNLFALRKDGTEFPVDIMLKPLETPAGTVVLSFIRDNTEQHNAQEALRRADLQLRSIVEGIRDYAIYLLDRDGNVMPPGTPARSESRATLPMRFLGCIFPASSSKKTVSADALPSCFAWPRRVAAWKRKPGGCAKTARVSGPM